MGSFGLKICIGDFVFGLFKFNKNTAVHIFYRDRISLIWLWMKDKIERL